MFVVYVMQDYIFKHRTFVSKSHVCMLQLAQEYAFFCYSLLFVNCVKMWNTFMTDRLTELLRWNRFGIQLLNTVVSYRLPRDRITFWVIMESWCVLCMARIVNTCFVNITERFYSSSEWSRWISGWYQYRTSLVEAWNGRVKSSERCIQTTARRVPV